MPAATSMIPKGENILAIATAAIQGILYSFRKNGSMEIIAEILNWIIPYPKGLTAVVTIYKAASIEPFVRSLIFSFFNIVLFSPLNANTVAGHFQTSPES